MVDPINNDEYTPYQIALVQGVPIYDHMTMRYTHIWPYDSLPDRTSPRLGLGLALGLGLGSGCSFEDMNRNRSA